MDRLLNVNDGYADEEMEAYIKAIEKFFHLLIYQKNQKSRE